MVLDRLFPCFILFVICGVVLCLYVFFATNGGYDTKRFSSSVNPQPFNTECGI